MPNLSPEDVRKNYLLYDNKIGSGDAPSDSVQKMREEAAAIGYEPVVSRGDYPED